MLRKIIELRGAITRSTDANTRHAKWQELCAALLEARKSHLPCIREEVRELTVDALALISIADLDDSLIIPIVLSILFDLKSANEVRLSGLLQQLLERDLLKELKAKSIIDLFNMLLVKSVERLFEQFLNEKKIDQVTSASVSEFMAATTAALCKALAAKYKFDPAKLTAELTASVSNELALAFMYEMFKATDNQQTASVVSSIFSGFSLSRDKIIKPYTALPFCAAALLPEQAALPLLSELALWFEGLHYYHSKLLQVKLRNEGVSFSSDSSDKSLIIMPENKPYPPANEIDAVMYRWYGLTFYDLARLVFAAREALVRVLPAPRNEGAEITVTVCLHSVFARNDAAASAVAAASVGTDVFLETQSAPNFSSG